MVDVRKAPKKGKGTCVYCGRERNLTKDHLFPRALFIVKDRDMVTVPACCDCQRKKEHGDREHEIYVTLDILGSGHSDFMTHLQKIVNRNEGTKRRLDRMINGADYVALTTEGGFQVAEGLAAEFNIDPIIEMLNMAVRGLYWNLTGLVLPMDTPTYVERVPWNIGMELLRRLGAYQIVEPTVKGNLVVWWSELPVEQETTHDRFWVVCFNDAVVFLLGTGAWANSLERIQQKLNKRKDVIERFSDDVELIRHLEAILPRDSHGRYTLPPTPPSSE